jgi:hypothetical protein
MTLICDDCEADCTDYVHAIQVDPWEQPTGTVYCEKCHEKHWYRQQERLMEDT